jgi:hypothetical protein
MAQLHLKSYRFRAEREDDWRRLETLLGKVGKGSPKALSDEELLALPVLYRQALSSLSVARATSLDQSLVDYLESLSARAYFLVYGTRSSLFERLGGFFGHAWPAAAKALWRETLVSFLLTAIGVAAAYFLTLHDPDWFSAFVPDGLAGGRGPAASVESMRAPRSTTTATIRAYRCSPPRCSPTIPAWRSSPSRWGSPSACRPPC